MAEVHHGRRCAESETLDIRNTFDGGASKQPSGQVPRTDCATPRPCIPAAATGSPACALAGRWLPATHLARHHREAGAGLEYMTFQRLIAGAAEEYGAVYLARVNSPAL